MNKPQTWAEHKCNKKYDDAPPSQKATCGICNRSWCDYCDPAPSALCPYCHGVGYSTAPIEEDDDG